MSAALNAQECFSKKSENKVSKSTRPTSHHPHIYTSDCFATASNNDDIMHSQSGEPDCDMIYISHLAVLDNAHSFFGREQCQVWKAHTLTIRKVYVSPHLAVLVLHQGLVGDRVHFAHVDVRVLVRVKHPCNFVFNFFFR